MAKLGPVETMVRDDHDVRSLTVDAAEHPTKRFVASLYLVLVFRALSTECVAELVRVQVAKCQRL